MIFHFIIGALAVYRVARMAALERGPFEVFERWRGFVLRRCGLASWVFDGFTCPLCLSFWLGFIGALWVADTPEVYVPVALALSGAATLLYGLERE